MRFHSEVISYPSQASGEEGMRECIPPRLNVKEASSKQLYIKSGVVYRTQSFTQTNQSFRPAIALPCSQYSLNNIAFLN